MLNSMSPNYARLPTFSAVIDGLASGLGVVRNKEDSLVNLGSFSGRIDAYGGSPGRSGLEEKILNLLVGSNEDLRNRVRARLLDAEATLTNARAQPLVTEATETEGNRCFIEIWAIPWIAQIINDAGKYPDSVLHSARILIEMYSDSYGNKPTSYLTLWKSAVRKAIPDGVVASEFRTILTKLDQRSRRKIASIEKDIKNLHLEMQGSNLSQRDIDGAISNIRRLYLAGTATMRLSSMAVDIIPEQDLLAMVFSALTCSSHDEGVRQDYIENKRAQEYWHHLNALKLSEKYEIFSNLDIRRKELNFEKLHADLRVTDPAGLLIPAINFSEGVWHFSQEQICLTKNCFQQVVASAKNRQLGEVAACAASILIALRVSGHESLKFEELNPLMRVRIENMPQLEEIFIDYIPTPFSDWSPRPKPRFYDLHLMQCVAFFNNFSRSLNVTIDCNPLIRFDADVKKLVSQSRERGAKMADLNRKSSVIAGTSVKPYQVLRDHFYYRNVLFGLNPSNLPGMDFYMALPAHDQLRVLRFVDPEQFQLDLESHGMLEWRHPDDVL